MNASFLARIGRRLAWAAAVLAAIAAAAGLFVPHLYRDSDAWVRQAQASDVATLFVAVPLLIVALWRARTGGRMAPLLALGALAYLAYAYAIFAFAVAVNSLTLFHYAILGLSIWSIGFWLAAIGTDAEAATPRLPRRTTGVFLIVTAALFAVLWLGQIAASIASGERTAALADLGLTTNPVWALDLAFALPAFAVAGVLLLRRTPVAPRVALPLLIFASVMGASILVIFAFDGMAGAAVDPVPVALVGSIVLVATVLSAAGLARSQPAHGRPLGYGEQTHSEV
jgi:hypothetical protein